MYKTSDVLSSEKSSAPERYYVYTLFSLKDYKFYTGFTTGLKERLTRHARGEVTSTRLRLPFKLIHYEYFVNKSDALAREKFLKSGFGRRQLKLAVKGTLQEYTKD